MKKRNTKKWTIQSLTGWEYQYLVEHQLKKGRAIKFIPNYHSYDIDDSVKYLKSMTLAVAYVLRYQEDYRGEIKKETMVMKLMDIISIATDMHIQSFANLSKFCIIGQLPLDTYIKSINDTDLIDIILDNMLKTAFIKNKANGYKIENDLGINASSSLGNIIDTATLFLTSNQNIISKVRVEWLSKVVYIVALLIHKLDLLEGYKLTADYLDDIIALYIAKECFDNFIQENLFKHPYRKKWKFWLEDSVVEKDNCYAVPNILFKYYRVHVDDGYKLLFDWGKIPELWKTGTDRVEFSPISLRVVFHELLTACYKGCSGTNTA